MVHAAIQIINSRSHYFDNYSGRMFIDKEIELPNRVLVDGVETRLRLVVKIYAKLSPLDIKRLKNRKAMAAIRINSPILK